jgi:4-carboxymuconolactone decarboxylase
VNKDGSMRTRLLSLLLVGVSVGLATGQAKLPADINPTSYSRLPPVDRAALDDEGKKVWDYIAGGRGLPATGPAQVSMHSPGAAKPIHELNQYLRKTVVGPRFFELSALIAAREFDQNYEWSGHEPAGLRAGLEQNVIDVVKFKRDVTGLSEKDATVIRLGRALLRDHRVSPELWAKTVELFGRQGAVEITAIIGDYVMAGIMLTAVDQQLPPNRPSLLPVR